MINFYTEMHSIISHGLYNKIFNLVVFRILVKIVFFSLSTILRRNSLITVVIYVITEGKWTCFLLYVTC